MNAAGPVIEVVSGGTSWPAIVAAISGGVVGLAGIGATVWASVRNSRVEDKRAHRAEKRRVYVSYLTSITELTRLSYMTPETGNDNPQTKAMSKALSALNEVILIGGPEAQRPAETLLSRQFDIVEAARQQRDCKELNSQALKLLYLLHSVMRADLGEPRVR